MIKHTSNSIKDTNKIAKELASRLRFDFGEPRGNKKENNKSAIVIGLSGDLGAGKTTFTKSFAKALGVKETVKSPTFNLMKIYRVKDKNFIHIDAYRLRSAKDILTLGWKELIKDPGNVIVVEWAENIKKVFPKKYFWLKLSHLNESQRGIDIKLVK